MFVATPGRYALAGLHDEDDDGGMDKDMFGLPQEGYTFSKDARPSISPPSFESAAVSVRGPVTLTLTMHYGI
jgi:uncharacterized protein (DUF2141 family)